jgi:hypothetical protein
VSDRASTGMLATSIALVALTGCGSPVAAPPPAPAVGNGLPPRPAVLRIDGIDPCTLLTPAQAGQLDVEEGRRNDYAPGTPIQGTACDWSTDEPRMRIHHGASLILNRGADYALGQEPLRNVDGYTATTTSSDLEDPRWHCFVVVDTGPGQSLLSDYSVDTRDIPGMTHEKACDRAQAAAAMMLENLRAAQH